MTDTFKVMPTKSFDYMGAADPTISVDPPIVPATWLNTDTCHIWVCIDNTIGSNVWVDNG